MSKNEETKNYFITLKDVEIPVTEEVYRAYYRPVWAAIKRKEREKRCRNADGSRCTEDCDQCDREPDGGFLSLDKLIDEGYETADSDAVDDIVMEKMLIDELYAALDELSDDERNLVSRLLGMGNQGGVGSGV